jgi:predicted Zn-dependent peptidase
MKFQKKILDNGLVVLFEKRDVPVTTVMLAAKYGSAFENESEKGIAHFIEHMAFKGTEKRNSRQIAFEVEKVGGILNAFTEEEETAYHVKLPSEHLDKAMEILFDIFFNPVYPADEVKKEANVICEEIKMYSDSPQRYVIEKIKECLYESPFGLFAAGSEKIVRSFTREKLAEKMKKIYCPENSILCVVGNNDFEMIVELAKKLSANRKLGQQNMPEIKKRFVKTKETRKNLEQANLAIGFHLSHKDKYPAQVFSNILGGGMSSKLFSEVREKRGLAYAVKTMLGCGKNYCYLIIYVGTDKEKTEEVIKICLEEFRKMGKISEQELADGKEQTIGNQDVDTEDSSSAALNLVLEEVSGKAEDYYKFKEKINNVSLDDIKKISQIKDYSYFILTP